MTQSKKKGNTLYDKTRQYTAIQDKTTYDNTKTIPDKLKQYKTIWDKTIHDNTRQHTTRSGNTI